MPIEESGMEAEFTLEMEKTGVIEEMPFRVLALGDWSGNSVRSQNSGHFSERRLFEIDRDNFDEVMAKLGVNLELQTSNAGTIRLDFHSLDDFHPDEIFRRVSLFSELRELRLRLNKEDTFHAAAREVRRKVTQDETDTITEPQSQTSDNLPLVSNLLEAILARPEGGLPAPKQGASGELRDLVSDFVRPYLVSVDEDERSQLLAAVDSATGDLMRGILGHPRFKELEAAWRGLYFLIRRTETSNDLKIFILDATKSELASDLRAADNLTESVLYKHLVREAVEIPGSEPWAVVLGNYGFGPNVDDVATLIRTGKIAAAAGVSFISRLLPDFFGFSSLADAADPALLKISPNGDAGKLWAALRGQTEADNLGMVFPRFLARLPYGSDTDPLESFAFEEFSGTPMHEDYLWANGCFAVGQLLSASFSSFGWEMARGMFQDIEGLPVHIYKDGTETVFKPCAELLMPQSVCEQLMEQGLMMLISYKNTDRVKLARFQSIADPVTELKGRWC